MYEALIGAIVAALIGIGAALPKIIHELKYNAILRKSQTESHAHDIFVYKNKYYDREKYIALRMESIKTLSSQELEQLMKKAKDAGKGESDLAKAEIEAIERIKKYHESKR